MVHITIRDLHMKTGDWVRKAARSGGVVVTDRNRPVAKLTAFTESDERKNFSARPLVKGFAELPRTTQESGRYVSDDRERE